MLTCAACKRKTCALHRIVFHDGMTCEEYDAFIAQAPAADKSEAWVKAHCKLCPKCSSAIEVRDPGG